jgi:hypothetical protein
MYLKVAEIMRCLNRICIIQVRPVCLQKINKIPNGQWTDKTVEDIWTQIPSTTASWPTPIWKHKRMPTKQLVISATLKLATNRRSTGVSVSHRCKNSLMKTIMKRLHRVISWCLSQFFCLRKTSQKQQATMPCSANILACAYPVNIKIMQMN